MWTQEFNVDPNNVLPISVTSFREEPRFYNAWSLLDAKPFHQLMHKARGTLCVGPHVGAGLVLSKLMYTASERYLWMDGWWPQDMKKQRESPWAVDTFENVARWAEVLQ